MTWPNGNQQPPEIPPEAAWLESLHRVLADEPLKAEPKLAYLWRWAQLGSNPDVFPVTLLDLGKVFGRTSRAAKRWLLSLAKAGLIEIGETDDRLGRWMVCVYRPCPCEARSQPDPQRRLALRFVRPEADEARLAGAASQPPSARSQPPSQDVPPCAIAPQTAQFRSQPPHVHVHLQERNVSLHDSITGEGRATAARFAGGDPEPIGNEIVAAVAAILEKANDPEVRARRRQELAEIQQRIVDPDGTGGLFPSVLKKVADAVMAGVKMTFADMQTGLDYIQDLRRIQGFTKGPGAAYVAWLKREFPGVLGVAMSRRTREATTTSPQSSVCVTLKVQTNSKPPGFFGV